MKNKLCSALGLACAAILFLATGQTASTAVAATYPEKPVQLLVGYSAGGSTDMVARALAEDLGKIWPQPVSVINKPGASGGTAILEVKAAKPDGHTMLVHVNAGVTNPALNPSLPYKWDDLTYVLRLVTSPLVIIVRGDGPYHSIDDLLKALKTNPGGIKLGLSGAGGSGLFGTVQMAASAGFDVSKVIRIVQSGGNQVAASVAGGHVDYAIQYLSEVEDLVKAGKLRALAVVNAERVSALPDVPTVAEVGLAEMNWQPWIGIAGPPGTPSEVVQSWNTAIGKLLKSDDFTLKLRRLGFTPAYMDAKEFKNFSAEFYKIGLEVKKAL